MRERERTTLEGHNIHSRQQQVPVINSNCIKMRENEYLNWPFVCVRCMSVRKVPYLRTLGTFFKMAIFFFFIFAFAKYKLIWYTRAYASILPRTAPYNSLHAHKHFATFFFTFRSFIWFLFYHLHHSHFFSVTTSLRICNNNIPSGVF